VKKTMAWVCVIGGLLWGLKPIYDAQVNGRKLNTGYIPSDPTDYIKFIFPLLCLGGLMKIYFVYKRNVRNSVMILLVAVILSGLFHFTEIYFYDSGLPFGFIFLFFSTISMIIGAMYLVLQLRRMKDSTTSLLVWCIFFLFLDNFLLVVLAFFTELLPVEMTNPIMAVLMVSIGFIWALIGMALLKVEDPNKV
jgi:hypothetical protein